MTTEQLQAARAQKWRQKANPLLTIEDAGAWIESTGVSLFLPRKIQLQAPAPSFVEAVLGETNATPQLAAIQNAFETASRLFVAEKATPLNLLGTVSEQPDFLVSPEALPYVFALRGDREWKRGPRDKSSPLVVESWKLLKREGALTTSELQDLLGREVTEGAVLRSMSELWTALRVLPVYSAGEATAWELFESRNQKAMQIGSGMAQATALSALVSLYLDSAIAATAEEIEAFLSPLAPRSRIREVVRGLAATRQLLTLPLGTQSLLHIAGGLPEFPEVEPPVETPMTAMPPRDTPREPRPFVSRRESPRGPGQERPPFRQRPAASEGRKTGPQEWKRPGSDRPRREWKPRPGQHITGQADSRPQRPASAEKFRQPSRPSTGEQSSATPERKNWKPRPQGDFRPRRADGSGKPYRERTTGDKRPTSKLFSRDRGPQKPPRKDWKPRPEGSGDERRRTEGSAGFGRPYRKRTTGDERPAGKFPSRDRGPQRPPRKDWKPRPEGGTSEERREFRPRRAGEPTQRREFKPRPSSGSGFRPRRIEGDSTRALKSTGEKRFGEKHPIENREGRKRFDRKKPPQREGREPEVKRTTKPFSKPGGKPGKRFGSPKGNGRKPTFGAKRSSRPSSKPSFGKRPNNRTRKKSDE